MKSKLSCLLFALLAMKSYSQETEVTSVIKATILNPGVSYEQKLGTFTTAYAQFFMNTSSYSWSDNYGEAHIKLYFDPALTLQGRLYYNARKREEKGKRTEMNSMNYFAVVGETIYSKIPLASSELDEDKRRAINQLGVCWGLQRNNEGRFSIDLYFGLGLRFSSYTTNNAFFESEKVNFSETALMGQLNIGFWLNKRK